MSKLSLGVQEFLLVDGLDLLLVPQQHTPYIHSSTVCVPCPAVAALTRAEPDNARHRDFPARRRQRGRSYPQSPTTTLGLYLRLGSGRRSTYLGQFCRQSLNTRGPGYSRSGSVDDCGTDIDRMTSFFFSLPRLSRNQSLLRRRMETGGHRRRARPRGKCL